MRTTRWASSLVVWAWSLSALAQAVAFQPLQPGVEYGTLTLTKRPEAGDGKLHVVRVDPALAELDLGLASQTGQLRTAAQWAHAKDFSVVINAGMYETDYRSNVGRLVHGEHVNQRPWKKSYQSVLVFGPLTPGLPRAQLLDRDAPDFEAQVKGYRTVVQNLRLVKGTGENVWKPNKRRWSEAFVAVDDAGRLLFAFTRTPFEMAALMDLVLASDLHVLRAMHVEGGPEASLTIRAEGVNVDLAGSYETGFFPRDDNRQQWELPNVLGVRAVKPKG
ncbi:MAG: phosphodiester glycosidase family protein [Myxococcaceae bacterium]|jgi:hypothetical protein|nr:phosphodiester glycosidase family protein [Myxococcaceae bacterium]